MSTVKYNKLVRDHVPEIIAACGKHPICATLSEDDYRVLLDQKLIETLEEYLKGKSMEALADLTEVIRAIAKARGSSVEEVEAIRREKAATHGAYDKRIMLEEVITGD